MKSLQWEYYSLPFPGKNFFTDDIETVNFQNSLNKLGEEGWELVSVFMVPYYYEDYEDNSVIAVFKRPLKKP